MIRIGKQIKAQVMFIIKFFLCFGFIWTYADDGYIFAF
jgi:hypothetical protein